MEYRLSSSHSQEWTTSPLAGLETSSRSPRRSRGVSVIVSGSLDETSVVSGDPGRKSVSWRTVRFCCASVALGDLSFSQLVAFFPGAALRHGLGSNSIGAIFGLMPIGALLSAPCAPTLCRRLGSTRLLCGALGLQASCMLVFSFTDRLPTWQSFLATCACVRFVQGMLNAMIQTAAVGLLMRSVPEDRIGDALGWSEAMRGVGIMLGPGIGGGLYLALGFKAPFVFASAAWAPRRRRAACTR